MQVALVFPNYWPYVRRGAERLMAEYAQYLTGQGHLVDIITSKPGRSRVAREGNLTIYYESQLDHPVLNEYWFWFRSYSFSVSALLRLLQKQYDVIHIWFYTYGFAAMIAKRLRGVPYLYQSMAEALTWPGWVDRWLLRRVLSAADKLAAVTPRSAMKMQADVGMPVTVIPPCVDMRTFVPNGGRDLDAPRVLFVSDVTDFRKGASLLFMAWDEVHQRCPQAVLTFAGPLGQVGIRRDSDTLRRIRELVRIPSARAAIEFAGTGTVEALPRRYANASVTVLPSVGDVFGLVLVESLACGTPVVGNAFEGPGEIISDPLIGATVPLREAKDLLDPERAHQLAESLLYTIHLARDPSTALRCRDHASQWSREVVGRQLELAYRDMGSGLALKRQR